MIAEFWNTVSSVPLSLVALLGLYFAFKYRYPRRIAVSYFGVFIVGLGSVAFHSTLTKWGQALDELSMVYSIFFFLPSVRIALFSSAASAVCNWFDTTVLPTDDSFAR
jgi:hypothetical protein